MITLAICVLAAGCASEVEVPRFSAAPGSPYSVGMFVGRPAIGDLNGDGRPDIVVGYEPQRQATQAHLAVLLADAKGGFTVRKLAGTVSPSGLLIALGDLDEDGKLDVAAIAHDSNEMWRFKGDGKGGLAPWAGTKPIMRRGGEAHTHDLVFRDIDGDRHLDALTTNANDNTVSLALGDGKGGFSPAPSSPYPAGNHPYTGLALGDFNGDKVLDIAVPNVMGNAVTALLGDAKGGFRRVGSWPVGPRPSVTAVGDVNGDGRLDLIATHDDDPLLAVLLGDGKGGFRNVSGSPFTLPQRVWGIGVADMTGDGHTDLVLGAQGSEVILLIGDGTGAYGNRAEQIPVGARAPGQLTLADMNGDGKLDIVTGNHDGGSVSVLLAK